MSDQARMYFALFNIICGFSALMYCIWDVINNEILSQKFRFLLCVLIIGFILFCGYILYELKPTTLHQLKLTLMGL